MRSCKSPGKPVRQIRQTSERFELRYSFYMWETNWSSKLTFSRERQLGIAPVNVRGVSESHEIIKQITSGFGVVPRDPTRPARQVSPHDLVMGGISRAGSQHHMIPNYCCCCCFFFKFIGPHYNALILTYYVRKLNNFIEFSF